MSRRSGIFSFLVMGLLMLRVPPLCAYELAAAEQDKLLTAQRLAAKVYQEAKDAAGAIRVLEEAGITRLEKGRPGNMQLSVYLDLLEAYGGYLARAADTSDTAANYLKIVIKADPARSSAYLSLGELYYRLHQQKPDTQYQRIYQGAFTKYVEGLVATTAVTVLPQYLLEAVYPQAQDVCLLIQSLKQQQRLSDLDILFNPERGAAELRLDDPHGIHNQLGMSFASFAQTGKGPIMQSQVDIDNDGSDELRFRVATAAGCERNLFYKKFGGQMAVLSNDLLDEYYAGTRICGGGKLQTVRVNGGNYLLEQQLLADGQRDLIVYELKPSGEYRQRCGLSAPTPLEQNLSSHCSLPVCDRLSVNISKIVAAEGQVGSEWLITDVKTQKFAADVSADPGLKAYLESQHQYLADLDNDGEQELIARVWRAAQDGKLEYQHRLFKLQNGEWNLWQLPALENGAGPGQSQWFFVESFENRNYIVTYTAFQTADAGSQTVNVYQLVVFELDNARFTKLGELRTQQSQSSGNNAAIVP